MKHGLWLLLLLLQVGSAWGKACAHDEHWREIASGTWVWLPTVQADISTRNRGHVLATSVIVDQGDAMVIDPGPSHRHGQQVLDWVRCRWHAQVKWVINTHAHAENVLGNSAFAKLQSTGSLHIAASLATHEAMQRRCEQCLAHLRDVLGPKLMRRTRIVLPNRTLQAGERLTVGSRQVEILLMENAHTESDTVLWVPSLSTAFAGGLVYEDRIPELAQGSIDGWLKALNALENLRAATVVGTGLSTSQMMQVPSSISYTRRYLAGLRSRLLQGLDSGHHASEAIPMDIPAYATSAGYQSRHAHNVQRGWREMETYWMNQPQTSGGS